MYLKSINFIPVSGLADQWRYTNTLHVTNEHLGHMTDTIRRTGDLDHEDIADALGSAVTLGSVAENVSVSGGWGGDRYRFIAEFVVEEVSSYGVGNRVVICGYTDRAEISRNETLADDTRLYLNCVMQIRDSVVEDELGGTEVRSVVISNDQLLSGRYEPRNRNSEFTMRPTDVFISLNQLHDVSDSGGIEHDGRLQFGDGAKTSRRSNNLGGRFMSRLVDADVSGRADTLSYDDNAFRKTRNNQASSKATETQTYRNPILRQWFNSTDVQNDRTVMFQDLCEFTDGSMRELDKVTRIGVRSRDKFDYYANELDSAYEETKVAVTIANAVPAIMSDLAISSIKFTCGNEDTVDGQPEMNIPDITTYISGNLDVTALRAAFRTRFIREVYDVLSRHNNDIVILDVYSEVYGVTRVSVALGARGGWEKYVIGSFADSNLTPAITDDFRNLKDVAERYLKVREEVDGYLEESERNARRSGKASFDLDDRRDNRRNRDRDDRRGGGVLDLGDLDL